MTSSIINKQQHSDYEGFVLFFFLFSMRYRNGLFLPLHTYDMHNIEWIEVI